MKLIFQNGNRPPGWYPYVDPRTGMKFPSGLDFGDQVKKIQQHRLRNPEKYPPTEPKFLTKDFIADELSEYTCARVNNSPVYCFDDKRPPAQPQSIAAAGRKCDKCGGQLTDRICGTCSGYKVVGYRCESCKKDFPK